MDTKTMNLFQDMLKKTGRFTLLLSLYGLLMGPAFAAGPTKSKERPFSINPPQQITSETDPMLYAAVSKDGQWLVYTAERKKFSDLWLRSADPSIVRLPERLTNDPAGESSPAFSPDGRYIAYVSTKDDAKGDIYLLDLKDRHRRPIRLTGRDTEDGAPSFSHDGKKLYFHQKRSDDPQRGLVRLNIDQKVDRRDIGNTIQKLFVGGDGAFPSVSPDGLKIAFLSHRYDPAGDIFVLDLQSNKIDRVTDGPFMDFFPAWSADSKTILFSRFAIDSNHDGRINTKDNAVIFKTDLSDRQLGPFPLTSAKFSSFQPHVAGKKIFFLSNRTGTSNCWSLPMDGRIPAAKTAKDQLKLARHLSRDISFDPFISLLAFYKILERFADETAFGAAAAFGIGKIYQNMKLSDDAYSSFQLVLDHYPGTQPEAALSRIEQTVIRIRKDQNDAKGEPERRQVLNKGLATLERISKMPFPIITARSNIERARLLSGDGQGTKARLYAIGLLESVIQNRQSSKEHAAEAMVLKADIYSQISGFKKIYPLYLSVIKKYPDISIWSDVAAWRLLNLTISGPESKSLDDRLKRLRKVAAENREKTPLLSAGALNYIGDLLFEAGEWSRAKNAYRQVLDEFPDRATQAAAARFSLAEILYKEERFRRALKLYETEIALRPNEDRIYQLAREGYIRKSLAGGEYLYRLGEIFSARKIFKELIEYDDTIVAAHRGYIKSAVVQNDLKNVLNAYRSRMKQHPDDPIARYATALCLTYLKGRDALKTAKQLLLRAIRINGQVEYFHQTLGYVLETLETVYGVKGGLEIALESYKKAYFLNDHQNNPSNAANLLLNLGNTYFLLDQPAKAFYYFTRRLQSKRPFQNKNTEILFYQRLGKSAFQVRESEATIDAFTKALSLINQRMQPMDASGRFDRIIRYIMDQLLSPLLKGEGRSATRAKTLAKSQSQINHRLSKLSRTYLPPPDPQWHTYKDGMTALLSEQERLNQQLIFLVKKHQNHQAGPIAVRQRLSAMMRRIDEALRFPGRLIHLKAELLDRLGLAYQEADQWEKAIETYTQVFSLNRQLSLSQNLARNKRSIAYNRYQLAKTLTGEARVKQLNDAAKGFSEVIDLVDRYGVPDRNKKMGKGLFSVDLQLSIDETGSTRAGHGFSKIQEKRLAEAFISRIQVELDELIPAEKAINKQLAQYPLDRPVADKDLYGVSLLYHRAGHLAVSREKYIDATLFFRFSADLALRMKNSVSTAINVMNMAKLLNRMPVALPDRQAFVRPLNILDRKTSLLLDQSPDIAGLLFSARYHNAMGVYALTATAPSGDDLEKTLFKVRQLQNAAFHFTKGLRLFEKKNGTSDRKRLALYAALHLNLAKTALGLGETDSASVHFKKALRLADRGLLPEIKWRAYAGLGRFDEALDALASVNILSAGCGPNEILDAFAPRVHHLVSENKIEEAFNLVERLSEIERFNRLAPTLFDINESEKALYKKIYPRLQRIDKLRKQISIEKGDTKQYLQKRLENEIEWVQSKTGKNRKRLPDTIRLFPDEKAQDQAMILLGLAVRAEAVADRRVRRNQTDIKRQGNNAENKVSMTPFEETGYEDLIQQYTEFREMAISTRSEEKPADIITFFGPEPFEAVDVMDALPENGKLIRIFKTDRLKAPPGSEWIVFTLTPDRIHAFFYNPATDDFQRLAGSLDGLIYLANEEVSSIRSGEIPMEKIDAFALSGTHLVRSILNRKPFKRTLLSIPPRAVKTRGYDPITLLDLTSRRFSSDARGVHTLLLSGPVISARRVPTRAGEYPKSFLALQSGQGHRVALANMLNRFENTSLALLPRASFAEAYRIGHLFSIYGIPTVLLPYRQSGDEGAVDAFLTAYVSTSLLNAAKAAQPVFKTDNRWIPLGYAGMTPAESVAFADAHFADYVKKGEMAYQNNRPAEALIFFENSLQIAENADKFSRYLSPLYRYARESAYKAGHLNKALQYADALAERIAKKKPGTQAHADALWRQGLIYSRLENYPKGVRLLEEALEIFSNLELAPRQISTLADLGVILENATAYDRAMDRFQSAASLSKVSNKADLLAGQHLNIGRIYDLRLSRYAPAIKSYKKALAIYKKMSPSAKTSARIAQSLLNIGRCYRLLGNFREADESYAGALKQARSAPGDPDLETKVIIEQANNAWFQAKYEEAFQLQRISYRMAKTHHLPLLQVIAQNTSGLLWWTLGKNQKALAELKKALSTARTRRVRDDEIATTLNNTGLVFREMGRYTEALNAFGEALAIDTRLRSRWAIAYDLRNQGLTYLRMGHAEKAVPLFQKSSQEAAAIGNRINEAKAILGLGDAYSATGQTAAAERAYQKALALSQSMSLRETEWRAIYGMATLFLAKKPERAESLLFQAVDVIERMRSDIKILQLKDSFLTNKLAVYETLCRLLADQGNVTASFEIAERSRSRNFIDLLGNQRLSLNRAIDQDRYDQQLRLRSRIEEQQALLSHSTETTERQIYQQTLAELQNDFETLMLEIQAENPQLSALVSVRPLSAKELVKKVDPDVALLAYYMLPTEIFCWIIRADGLQLFRTPINKEEMGEKILDYRRRIQNLEPLQDESRALFNLLLRPVMPHLKGVKKLGIIPHGPLHYLSFATLSDQNDFLIDRFPIFYLPSANVLNYTLNKRFKEKNLRVLAIGNPDLGEPVFDLPFSEHEVRSIKWNFPNVTIMTKERATEKWVVDNIEKFGIIHLASHGRFDPINPLFSAIKLAKSADMDGDLEAAEIFGLKINADIVVLSACQTGLGKVTEGDDVIGLNRSFFYAGTHTIISSLWRVSDVSTAILIKEFYRQYGVHDKSNSLRLAMLHVKKRSPHPGYWGAFTLVGDYY